MNYDIKSPEEERLLKELDSKTDGHSMRLKRYLAMDDLSRKEGSPLHEIVKRAKEVPSLKGFDDIKVPEIVPTNILFDLFNMGPEHPARSPSDTYYVDDNHVLRTHDTIFWYYYLNEPDIKKKIENKETLGAVCYGKVYRKDEIDRQHMNVFHQLGGWLIAPDDGDTKITPDDLKKALTEIATSVFGDIEFRFYDDEFPYTDPSFEMEAKINGEWVEMVGCGMVRQSVFQDLGLEGYHGWAFGFGLERLAIGSMALPDIRLLWSDDERVTSQLNLGQTYEEVSKFPPVIRDISFIVPKTFVPNDYFDFVREIAPGMIEQVELLDKYENDEKFGTDKLSYAYRITYRSLERTLTNDEIDEIHKKLEQDTEKDFAATIRVK